jgi:hypothetical protein
MAERDGAGNERYGDWRSLELAIKDAAKKAARQAGPGISAASVGPWPFCLSGREACPRAAREAGLAPGRGQAVRARTVTARAMAALAAAGSARTTTWAQALAGTLRSGGCLVVLRLVGSRRITADHPRLHALAWHRIQGSAGSGIR